MEWKEKLQKGLTEAVVLIFCFLIELGPNFGKKQFYTQLAAHPQVLCTSWIDCNHLINVPGARKSATEYVHFQYAHLQPQSPIRIASWHRPIFPTTLINRQIVSNLSTLPNNKRDSLKVHSELFRRRDEFDQVQVKELNHGFLISNFSFSPWVPYSEFFSSLLNFYSFSRLVFILISSKKCLRGSCYCQDRELQAGTYYNFFTSLFMCWSITILCFFHVLFLLALLLFFNMISIGPWFPTKLKLSAIYVWKKEFLHVIYANVICFTVQFVNSTYYDLRKSPITDVFWLHR
jgi:hypothetical protein